MRILVSYALIFALYVLACLLREALDRRNNQHFQRERGEL